MNSKLFFFSLLFFSSSFTFAQYSIREPNAIPLHGEWSFALDPGNMGVPGKWYMDNVAQSYRFDKVTVPHCFSTDHRYENFTGTVWYRKPFNWKPAPGKRVILHFDAAYYKTHVWLNNRKVGEHEGGYTPFEFDITDFLIAGNNLLAVSVNNDTWQPGTVPGAKDYNEVNNSFVGWMNYGGLIRPVYLTEEPEIYIKNLKVEAIPDLEKGTAIIRTKLRIRNASDQATTSNARYSLSFNGKTLPLTWKGKPASVSAGETSLIEHETTLTAAQVKLWGLDNPNLYQLKAFSGNDSVSSNFGIRKIEAKNAQLLLNGKPVRIAGGNRVVDYPGLGSMEPDWLIEKDFRMMKEAGMEFQRLTHYTPSEYFYDLADKYGMLIISEAGNWQLTPKLMDNDTVRANFRRQFKEMAERDWNHPSIIAYSVGNEYMSLHDSGKRWTRDMIVYAKEVDATRLYTFATMFLNSLPKNPEDEASQYVDFICSNTYGNHARALDHIHQLYPDKPILISEWGIRADTKMETVPGLRSFSEHDFGSSEVVQAKHISEVAAEIRKRPYVAGASWWTFNDYQSRHQGTNANGYRPWGIVRPDRSARPAYYTYQSEMAPVTIQKVSFRLGDNGKHEILLKVSARNDFPSYALEGYYMMVGKNKFPIRTLAPGESVELIVPVSGFSKNITVAVHKPTDFKIKEETFELDR
jgi:beta-glucuronidase